MNPATVPIHQVPVLLCGETEAVALWTEAVSPGRIATCWR